MEVSHNSIQQSLKNAIFRNLGHGHGHSLCSFFFKTVQQQSPGPNLSIEPPLILFSYFSLIFFCCYKILPWEPHIRAYPELKNLTNPWLGEIIVEVFITLSNAVFSKTDGIAALHATMVLP